MWNYRNHQPPVLLFDLGGVILDISFERVFNSWAKMGKCPSDVLLQRFEFSLAYKQHERGEISTKEFLDYLRSHLELNISDEEFLHGWNAIFAGIVPAMERLLKNLAEHTPIHLLTNTNKAHQQEWAQRYQSLMDIFTSVFSSCEMGMRKPEHACYEFVANQLESEPENIVFFDDSDENIKGAKAAGMQAILVKSTVDVKNTLKELGFDAGPK